MNKKEMPVFSWNTKTKEFCVLGHKFDGVNSIEDFINFLNDLQKENQQLKEQYSKLEEKYLKQVQCCNEDDCELYRELQQKRDAIDEAIEEIKNIQEQYHKLIMQEYKQEDSIFINKCCKTGFLINVKGYFDLIEIILQKGKRIKK